MEPYYAAAYASYKLEFLFRNSLLPLYYKPARYHLLMALRYIIGGSEMPLWNANKMVKYVNSIAEVMWSDDDAVDAFKDAIAAVDVALNSDSLSRDVVKTQPFTDAVKTAASAVTRAPAAPLAGGS